MIVLLSIKTKHSLTGGYFYNRNISDELSRSTRFSYICEPVDTIITGNQLKEKILHAEVLLVDSIFFSMPEHLKNIFNSSGLNGQRTPEKILLLHYLPWLEDDEIVREMNSLSGDVYDQRPAPIGDQAKALLPLFSRYICTSEFSKQALINTGIAGELICTAHPGVEVRGKGMHGGNRSSRNGKPVIFSTLAHWTPVKGIHRLPPLLKELREYDWRWVACGSVNDDTPYGRQVLSAINKAGIRDRVDLLGALPHEQAVAVLKKSTCLLVPSLFETYGMAAAESAASGTPVIAFETGGLPEAVRHGEDGFLCTTISQFGETLKRVLEDPDILPRPAAEFSRAQETSWEQTAETVRGFLQERR